MKIHIAKYCHWLLGVILILSTACDEKKIIEDNDLPYLFRPVNINIDATTTTVLISWAGMQELDLFEIEIHQGIGYNNLIVSDTVKTKFVVYTLAGDTEFSFRIRALGEDDSKNSQYEEATFKTPAENLFKGYKSKMIAKGKAEINWLPNVKATSLKFQPINGNASPIEFSLNEEEKKAGSKVCSGLSNDKYTVGLYNGTVLRGTDEIIIEGDVFLSNGDDLLTSWRNAPDGAVIVLEEGAMFPLTEKLALNKNIKTRGLSDENPAIIYVPSNFVDTYMFYMETGTTLDKVEFQNVVITGAMDNNEQSGLLLFDMCFLNQGSLRIDNFLFTNCTIKNFGNSIIMIDGGRNQNINNLDFESCIISNNSYSYIYGLINFIGISDNIRNITFRNSTIYKFKNYLIFGTNSEIENIILENCTFNEIMMNAVDKKMIMDLNNTTAVGNGILIRNCILGKSQPGFSRGIRVGGQALTIEGSYCTSDYDDKSYRSIIPRLTVFPGLSTDLWNDTETGNFSFKDKSFAGANSAGDPRWR